MKIRTPKEGSKHLIYVIGTVREIREYLQAQKEKTTCSEQAAS